ncbi:MAG TPA: ABC transporter permease [Actinomycetales bacterium]|nr:ABC transporter permease [Actinomycetales bacterium]
MSSAVGLIVRRELVTRLRSKMYVISTVLLLVAVVGFAVVMHVVGDRTGSSADVGLVPSVESTQPLVDAAGRTVGLAVHSVPVTDEAAGEQQLRDGHLDALVVSVGGHQPGTDLSPAGGTVQVVVKSDLGSQLRAALTVLARQVAQDQAVRAGGGDPAAVNTAVASSGVQVRPLETMPEYQSQRVVMGMVAGVLVYLALMIFGQVVAQGVIEEKTSRVVELLLATVRPWQLMLGKVVGIGIAGLLQMLIVVGAGVGAGLAVGSITMPSSVAVSTAVWTLVWFLVGFVMYALLFAAAGALVSRQEDAAGVTSPILALIIVPYVVGISVLPAQPDNGAATILSLVPVFSPTLMPVRIALGVAAGWEIALTLVLSVLLTAGLLVLTGRIYGNSVMRSGARVRLGDALRPL